MDITPSHRRPSLGICIPVWNRGPIFLVAFRSLLQQLGGIDATIWIFDNGSDAPTRKILFDLQAERHRIIKTYLPENMGIPYVTNVFLKAVQEPCGYNGHLPPDYLMVMDADAYFKKPVIDLIGILEKDYSVGLVSGHDSPEHEPVSEFDMEVNERQVHLKEKTNERMITMLMRKEEMLYNYPFAHYRNRDVDWEITTWGPQSLRQRSRRLLVACGHVLHLGASRSTWNQAGPAQETQEELDEVRALLEQNGIR